MSSKRGKKGAKHEGGETGRAKPDRPSAKAPVAMVLARHGTEMISRAGRGFSAGELSQAGLPVARASQWGAKFDSMRRSIIEGNVAALKHWGGDLSQTKKPEGRAKRVERELEKVEKEVVKEAEEVEEEVVRAGKAVKKEAGKAEKAVKARAEKPRSKAKKKTS